MTTTLDEEDESAEHQQSNDHDDKKKKKSKKETKRRRDDDDDKKKQRESKKAEKTKLLEQVPKTDEHGIAYTKLQLRRMMKRVKRGLPPVPTPEEEQERIRQEALTRKEEEAELAGLVYRKETVGGGENDDDDDEREQDEEHADSDIDEGHDDKDDVQQPQEPTASASHPDTTPPKKKTKRSKPVPSDYTCLACNNTNQPPHWIYDCPNKITVRGTNHVSKKLKGIHNPDSKKVFVSGLPFDAKRKDVERMFQTCPGKLVHCKLLTFPDTERCKGQAFLSFDTEDGAKAALKLSGTTIDIDNDAGDSKKKDSKKKDSKKGAKQQTRHELKLKVSKMKNRTLTKK